MGFHTEMLSRPRPREEVRYRAGLALLNAMSNAELSDMGIRPVDFPRIARDVASKFRR